MVSRLIFSGISSLIVGLLYAYVGYRLSKREVSQEASLAQNLFVIWWIGIALSSFTSAASVFLFVTGHLTVYLYQTAVQVSILVLMVALWGLLYYLVYLYTGNNRAIKPLTILYFLFYVALLALIQWVDAPDRIVSDGWNLVAEPQPDLPIWFGLLFVVTLLGPQLGAAIAYLRLYGKVDDRTQKYRIAMVAGSILVWFGTSMLAAFLQVDNMGWQIGSRLLSVVAALTILAAYLPPAWVQRRWAIRSISQEQAPVA